MMIWKVQEPVGIKTSPADRSNMGSGTSKGARMDRKPRTPSPVHLGEASKRSLPIRKPRTPSPVHLGEASKRSLPVRKPRTPSPAHLGEASMRTLPIRAPRQRKDTQKGRTLRDAHKERPSTEEGYGTDEDSDSDFDSEQSDGSRDSEFAAPFPSQSKLVEDGKY